MPNEARPADLSRLDALIARLRAPGGCPWDRKQTLPDLRAYLLEEAHELADAMDREDAADLCEELGDVLFQAAFVGRLAAEQNLFQVSDAIERVEHKMIDRHPHVFGDVALADSTAVETAWARHKLERSEGDGSALDGVPATLPALLHAYRVGQKAGALGFDWQSAEQVLEKIREELSEVEGALDAAQADESTDPSSAVREEIGDLLLAVAHLARHLAIDPEAALVAANRKFLRRFRAMEQRATDRGLNVAALDTAAWERLWGETKREEIELDVSEPADRASDPRRIGNS